jgi:hypothetical protein
MNELYPFVCSEELSNFPQMRFLKTHLIGHPGIIAGGCFKAIFSGGKPHDIDMFFRKYEDFRSAVSYFKEHKDEYKTGYENQNVVSFVHEKTNLRIECIRKIFGTPEEIIRQFDFTITKFAYEIEAEPEDGEDGETELTYTDKILFHGQFFEHLCMKRLVVDDRMPYPVSPFNRTYKYAKSGFFPCRETKLKILKAVYDMEEAPNEESFGRAMYEGHD